MYFARLKHLPRHELETAVVEPRQSSTSPSKRPESLVKGARDPFPFTWPAPMSTFVRQLQDYSPRHCMYLDLCRHLSNYALCVDHGIEIDALAFGGKLATASNLTRPDESAGPLLCNTRALSLSFREKTYTTHDL